MDARALHQEALVIDSHNDTIVLHIRQGNQPICGLVRWQTEHKGVISTLRDYAPLGSPRETDYQIDLAKMRAGGIDLGFFAVDVTTALGNRLAYAMDGLGYLRLDVEHVGAPVQIVERFDDIATAKEAGRTAMLLAIEHADATMGSLNVLRALYQVGVRSIGLTHNISSRAADGCWEAREGVGLSHYGVALVQEMNRLGIVLDLAHVSPGGFYHALEVSTRPVLFSHGNCAALCPHPRNLTDDQLRALGQQGGVIGLSMVPMFVDEHAPTMARWFEHLDHAVQVAGIDAVGLGSDFDGGGDLMPDATHYPTITEGLIQRGYAEEDIRKILGLNTLRLLKATLS